jgi:hypothetical protein
MEVTLNQRIFSAVQPRRVGAAMFNLFLHKFGSFGDSVKYMEGARTNGIGDSPLDVPGLGDEALYHGSSKYGLLLVRKGDRVYGFGVRNVTSDESISFPENVQALEKAVADLLLTRLP